MSSIVKFCVALALFLWASAFVGIREALTGYSPEGLGLLRFIIASISIGIICLFLPNRNTMTNKDRALMLLCGMIGVGVYNLCLNHGEVSINSGMSSFLIAQSPIITALLALVFLKEKINLLGYIGFIVSIVGVALIASGLQGGFHWDQGLTYIAIATIASGFYTLSQKPFVDKYHSIEVTAYYIWGGTLFLLLYFPYLQHDIPHASWGATITVLYLGIFPGAVGLLVWGHALTKISAARAGSFLYFMPFLTTLLGYLFLGEIPVMLSVIGGLIAIAGVWLVNHSYESLEPHHCEQREGAV